MFLLSPQSKNSKPSSSASNLTVDEVGAIFDKLKPVTADQIIGTWLGASVDTNHPAALTHPSIRWVGKTFWSTEDADAIMVYTNDGSRACDRSWGHARLRNVELRGVVSTAIIFDDFPIIERYRCVNDDLIAGEMDTKGFREIYFFYLHK